MMQSLVPCFSILLVDDEPAWLRSVSLTLARAGINNILTCSDSREVPNILARGEVKLVLLDLTMPHLPGEALLSLIAEHHPELLTIVVSGMNQIETAVRCMKLGAFEYFVKTVEEDRLVTGVLRAIRMLELERENQAISDRIFSNELHHPEAFVNIVTGDRAMLGIFSYIEAVAASRQPLLISGESGVGKELVARAAHALSGNSGPLVALNVAGLDDTVFADTLFGHVRGAYTGAEQARRGMIEEATDGTLFLDEIGDLSIPSQVKLLRLMQEGEYFPLGSDRPKRLKARIIVAPHQGGGRRVPPRPLLPAAHPPDPAPAPARTGQRHPALARLLPGRGGSFARQEEADPPQGTGAVARHLRLSRQYPRAEVDGLRCGQRAPGAHPLAGHLHQGDRPGQGEGARRRAGPQHLLRNRAPADLRRGG